MANLTITVDDAVLKAARGRAIHQGTSVNALLREYLDSYAGTLDGRRRAAKAILAVSARSRAAWKRSGTRDDLHER